MYRSKSTGCPHLVLLLFILLISACRSDTSELTADEQIRPDEGKQGSEAIENFIRIVEKYKKDHVGRGAHAKGHSCVKAHFKVLETLDKKYRFGVLTEPDKTFKAWIRFSNANSDYSTPDKNKDAHGMAVKLLHVSDFGETLIDVDPEGIPLTQDFLMADNPVFFSANINDYNQFLRSKSALGFFFQGLNPLNWRVREFFIALDTLKEPPTSPLWTSYYSNTAYKLGHHNIKFSAMPCSQDIPGHLVDTANPDFMRDNLINELKEGEGCFDFKVQLQDRDANMSVEDPSVAWDEDASPYVTVAKIILPKQSVNSPQQTQFCENLSFSPWHGLEAHRPIGQFNRIRRLVYSASSHYRHERNQTTVPDQLTW